MPKTNKQQSIAIIFHTLKSSKIVMFRDLQWNSNTEGMLVGRETETETDRAREMAFLSASSLLLLEDLCNFSYLI